MYQIQKINLKTIFAVIAAVILIFCIWKVLEIYQDVSTAKLIPPATRVLDRRGRVLYQTSTEGDRGAWISYEKIPVGLRQALVDSEDRRFWQHRGIDWRALVRAFRDRIQQGSWVGGGSTIEQQLMKNAVYPTSARTLGEKMKELIAARMWAAMHSKEQTMEAYLNTVSFGPQARGVAAAAQTFFRITTDQLNLPQSTMLIGMLPAPSRRDPFRHFLAAKEAQQRVMQRMVAQGDLSEADRALNEKSAFPIYGPKTSITAPHFVFAVLDEVEAQFPDVRRGGYDIVTTLDADLQRFVEGAIDQRLIPLRDKHVSNAAVMIMDPRTGDTLAYAGSATFQDAEIQGQVDMIRAKRQPGSALKPFLVYQSFLDGETPATVLQDLPVRYATPQGNYYPKNYSQKYLGPITMREALGSSLNIPMVRLLDQIGIYRFFGTLHQFGIDFPESPEHYGLSLVLGGGEVTLSDMVRAYGGLARQGSIIDLRSVQEIRTADGQVAAKNISQAHDLFPQDPRRSSAAWLVTNILSDQRARSRVFGEASVLDLGLPIAVKTGTTRDFHDNWAFGYTATAAVGVWVGNTDQSPMQGVSGISGAAPLWREIMQHLALADRPMAALPPSDVLQRKICLPSGKLTTDLCLKTRDEWFIAGTEPKELDDWYERCADGRVGFNPSGEFARWASRINPQGEELACPEKVLAQESLILSPLDGDVFTYDPQVSPELQGVPFIASTAQGQKVAWTLNGRLLDSTESVYFWRPVPGEYELKLSGATQTIHFRVH